MQGAEVLVTSWETETLKHFPNGRARVRFVAVLACGHRLNFSRMPSVRHERLRCRACHEALTPPQGGA